MKERPMQKIFGKNKGKLHRRLGVAEGEKIPTSKLAKAAKSKDPTLRREVAAARLGGNISRHSATEKHHAKREHSLSSMTKRKK